MSYQNHVFCNFTEKTNKLQFTRTTFVYHVEKLRRTASTTMQVLDKCNQETVWEYLETCPADKGEPWNMDKVLRTTCLKKVVANKQGGTKRKLKSRLINKSERMGTNLAVETPTFLSCTVTSTCWFAIMATMQFQLNLNSAILTCYWVQMQHHLHPTSAITTYRIRGCLRFPKENQI